MVPPNSTYYFVLAARKHEYIILHNTAHSTCIHENSMNMMLQCLGLKGAHLIAYARKTY